MAKRNVNAVAVAKLLGTEGFSPHVAGLVRLYCLRNTSTPEQRRRFFRTKKAWSEIVKEKLTDGDRMVLGKFIGCLQAMAFDTGLRVGLTAFLHGCIVTPAEAERMGDMEPRPGD